MRPDPHIRCSPSRYDQVAERSAAVVIRRYSGSFGSASLLLAQPVRRRIRNVYALVRVADEVVDHPDPQLTTAHRASMLDALQGDVHQALASGHSPNLVVHAFARTAVTCGIGADLVDPFFASMRMDLERAVHDDESFARYVYGSAEVVGLMCLRVFRTGEAPRPRADGSGQTEEAALEHGARRLGAAFQKLNFLRDLGEDHDLLGRSYFPGLEVAAFCDADRDRLLDDIDADLAAAAVTIPRLPAGSRRAVQAAHATFSDLGRRLRETPAEQIRSGRVSVPTIVKARIVGSALMVGSPAPGAQRDAQRRAQRRAQREAQR